MSLLFGAWLVIMTYCLIDIEKRLTLFAFVLAIFTFLLSRLIIPLFYTNAYIESAIDNSMEFSDAAYDFIYNALIIALITSYVGFKSVSRNSLFQINQSYYQSRTNNRIRKITKYLVYFTYTFCVINVLGKVYFVAQNGYEALFLEYVNILPPFLIKFVNIYTLVFYLFLATLPSKAEAKWPIILFIALGVVSLLTGQRGGFILNCILIVVYMFLRNQMTPNDLWIGRRGKTALIISVPLLCAFMFIIMLVRGGNAANSYDTSSLVIDFFFQQGTSLQVVGLTYDAQSVIPSGKFYTFGTIIDNFNDNFIFNLLGIAKSYRAQTPEFAINGHSLANYLTYTFETQRFLNGGGMGSSYVAEVWNDFGYLGLGLWSFMYGCILGKFYKWARMNYWFFGISFYMLMGIVFSPRAGAIDFIADILSPTNLLVMFIIYQYGRSGGKKVKQGN